MTLEEIMNKIGYPERHSGFIQDGYNTRWVINPKKLAEFLQTLIENK